jgi:putative oxidoreductase
VGLLAVLRSSRLRGPAAWVPTLVAAAAGLIFVSFGVGHFVDHASEVADFRRYEVPLPSLAVWAVGMVELGGGLGLLAGLFVRPVAAVLAADMVGVLVTAGRVEGGLLNLGIAPMLLVAMAGLVWAGPGRLSLDRTVTSTREVREPTGAVTRRGTRRADRSTPRGGGWFATGAGVESRSSAHAVDSCANRFAFIPLRSGCAPWTGSVGESRTGDRRADPMSGRERALMSWGM